MKVQWWVSKSEYDPAEFPERCRYVGLEEIGPDEWVHVVEEDCLQVIFTADEGTASLQLADGGWVEPSSDFRLVP